MAITLVTHTVVASVKKSGEDTFTSLSAGKEIKMEVDGVEIFKENVPTAKVWDGIISISIDETDA